MSMNKGQKLSQREIIEKPIYCNSIEFYVVLYGKKNILYFVTFSRINMKVWLWIYFPRKKIMSKLIYHILLNEKKEFVQGKEQNCFKIKIMLIRDRVLFTLIKYLLRLFPYSPQVKTVMSALGEKEMSFELIEAILKYIQNIGTPGAVLVFLPGWR